MKAARLAIATLAGCVWVTGCSGSLPMRNASGPGTPKSVSPGAIAPAPMAKTSILSTSVMSVKPQSAVQGQNWTQLPGSAAYVAAAPDGSLWALSTSPAGPDKYIWHYANGSWTNISGLASRLSAAPNGTLYAINSGGGTYAYSNGSWTALGGGASDITAASDGSIYVLSNGNAAGSDQAIWHYTNGWTQVPGSGVHIAASLDPGTYSIPGGTVGPNGLYILNSIGSIYYENAGGSFVQLPANASAIAPTGIGGVFVLGYPADPNGNSIYYYNLGTAGWTAQSGSGTGISADSTHVYVISSSGGIYYSPVTASLPGPNSALSFSGTQSTSAVFTYPSPSPYPSTNTTVTIAQNITVASSPNPFGSSAASDFHTVETDTAPLATHTLTTDTWLALSSPSSIANLLEYGTIAVDDSSDSLSANYTTPLILDQFPESNGASWQNGGAVTFNEIDSDGTQSTRTYSANGSYTETTSNTGTNVTLHLTENADGSGSYTSNNVFLDGNFNGFVYSVPSSGQLTVTANFANPATTPRVYTVPAWYTTPPVLFNQSLQASTNVAFPSSCNVPASYGTAGTKIVQTTNRLDTILGYTDAQTLTTYRNPSAGPVCVVLQDVQSDYYDYNDDFATPSAAHLHFPGVLLSTTTVNQTLTLQSGATIRDTGRRAQSGFGQLPALSPAEVAAAQSVFTFRIERRRHERETRLLRVLRSGRRSEQ